MQYTEIANQIFSAIDTIVDKKLEALAYDRCIVAQIVEKPANVTSDYYCKYQDNFFTANLADKGQKLKLRMGDYVYVLIPQNDFKNDKFILGRKRIVGQNDSSDLDDYILAELTEDLVNRVGALEALLGYQSDDDESNDVEIVIGGGGAVKVSTISNQSISSGAQTALSAESTDKFIELISLRKRVSALESLVGYQSDNDPSNDKEILIDCNNE